MTATTPADRSDGAEPLSRYVVGIDLGTTNCAVCYVDTDRGSAEIAPFAVPQLVAPGEVERRQTLPSFHYQPAAGEFAAAALRLPWQGEPPEHVVGLFAREHGRLVPGRAIDSAKSWLCHGGIDRTAPLLPWHGAEDATALSPVEVSARYLQHIRQAWDDAHRNHPLADQDVVLTLPASFDEVARELTVQAAKLAGLPRVVLIEEPQAAFYAWIDRHRGQWEQRVQPGQKILVCDIGGGTSDFTLIRVRRQQDERIEFHRVAVGDHLLLGGDNMDLAIAHHLEGRLADGGKLPPRQWSLLVRSCRHLKETLLQPQGPESISVNLPASGRRLVGGGQQIEVSGEEVRRLLLDGFLPEVSLDAEPQRLQSGFQEFGLPYAADAAITRQLAAFLTAHRHAGSDDSPSNSPDHDPARPDLVLFNGGVVASPLVRQRLLDSLSRWFDQDGQGWRPEVMENDRLDLAVAHGAAYFGMVRRGQGVRIAAALARTYYIEVDAGRPLALCLLPAGIEPGQETHLPDRVFELSLLQPVEFPLSVSSTRLTDRPGDLVPIDAEQLRALPPIRTVLRVDRQKRAQTIPVQLHARLTEIGTMELWCREAGGQRTWQLQFDIRAATQTDIQGHAGSGEAQGVLQRETVEACRDVIQQVFGSDSAQKPSGLPQRIEQAAGIRRHDWPPLLLRQIWEMLIELQAGRRKSAAHEARWLNLLGFALRPGFGVAVDDWRVNETWRAVHGKIAFAAASCQTESRILWRRIAGGLDSRKQETLAATLLRQLRDKHAQVIAGRGRGGDFAANSHDEAEAWRMLGALELLPLASKMQLGDILVDFIRRPKMQPTREAMVWALGRIGARVPAYGPLNRVIATDTAERWLRQLMKISHTAPDDQSGGDLLAVVELSRRTGDRFRDIGKPLRQDVLEWLEARGAPPHYGELVREVGRWQREEQTLVFGDTLPRGLRIRQ